MGVNVAGSANLSMAQVIGNDHNRRSVSNQQTSIGVAERVNRAGRKPSSFDKFSHPLSERSGKDGAAYFVSKDPIIGPFPGIPSQASPTFAFMSSCQALYSSSIRIAVRDTRRNRVESSVFGVLT